MIIDKLLSYIAPHECLSCSVEGTLLCTDCSRYLLPAPSDCYHCRRPTQNGRTCIACLPYSDLAAVQAATQYKAISKDLVLHLKFHGTQAAASEIADSMAKLIAKTPTAIVVPVPTATSRVRQRGYDQANLIARELARKTGVAYSPALRRSGQFHQVGSSRDLRTSQLQGAYRVAKPRSIKGMHVILIDDVLTTGSTLEAAAKVMKAAGAARVSGLVFARA